MAATVEMMTLDYWAHAHWDDPKLEHEIFDADIDDELDAMQAAAVAPSPAAPSLDLHEPLPLPDDFETVADQNWT